MLCHFIPDFGMAVHSSSGSVGPLDCCLVHCFIVYVCSPHLQASVTNHLSFPVLRRKDVTSDYCEFRNADGQKGLFPWSLQTAWRTQTFVSWNFAMPSCGPNFYRNVSYKVSMLHYSCPTMLCSCFAFPSWVMLQRVFTCPVVQFFKK